MLKAYLFFCFYYNLYWFFFEKNLEQIPNAPYIFPVLKDIVWIIFIFLSLIYVFIKETKEIKIYKASRFYNKNLLFVYGFFSLYLIVAVLHFSHKDFLEVIQHDIRNIIWYSPIIFLLPYLIKDNNDIKKIFRFLIFNGVIISIFGIVTKFLGKEFLLHGGYRVISTFGNPNNLALFLNILIFIILSKIFFEKKKNRKLIIFLGLFLLCLIFTVSLTNLLAFIIGILIFFLLMIKNKKGIIVILSISIFSFILFSFGFFDNILYKYERILEPNSSLSSYSGRVQQFYEVIDYSEKTNLSSLLFGDFSLKRYHRYDSQYWNILVNDGLILLIYFIFLFLYIIYLGFKKANYFLKNNEYELASIFMGISIALLTVLIVDFYFTAYLNRFPFNFLIYFFIGIILLTNFSNSAKVEVKDQKVFSIPIKNDLKIE